MANVVFQWGPGWNKIKALSPDGFNDPLVRLKAKQIIGDLHAAGAKAIRVPGTDYELVAPLLDAMGAARELVIAFNSVWRRDDKTIRQNAESWLGWTKKMLQQWRPHYVLPDLERSKYFQVEKVPDLPWRLRQMVDEYCGVDVPVIWYNGDANIGHGAGCMPAPRFYHVWKEAEKQRKKTTDIIKQFIEKSPVIGGYPWLSAQRDAWNSSAGYLKGAKLFVAICEVLRDAGAAGFSMYASPYSGTTFDFGGSLDSSLQQELLEIMALGAAVWD